MRKKREKSTSILQTKNIFPRHYRFASLIDYWQYGSFLRPYAFEAIYIIKTPGQLLSFHFVPLCSTLVDISISFEAVVHSFWSFSFPLSSQVHKVAVESLATTHWKANLFVCLCQMIWFTVPASIVSSQDCLLWAAGAQMGQALLTHSFILLTDGQWADIQWRQVSVGWQA